MGVINEKVREALAAGHLAHLVTLNADGSPQVSVVWAGLEGDDVVVGHLGRGRKMSNVHRDPRVAVSLATGGRNDIGLDHYLILHGTARVEDGGGAELLQRLAEVYIGPGVKFPPFDNPPPGRVMRITVDRVGGVGPWND